MFISIKMYTTGILECDIQPNVTFDLSTSWIYLGQNIILKLYIIIIIIIIIMTLEFWMH